MGFLSKFIKNDDNVNKGMRSQSVGHKAFGVMMHIGCRQENLQKETMFTLKHTILLWNRENNDRCPKGMNVRSLERSQLTDRQGFREVPFSSVRTRSTVKLVPDPVVLTQRHCTVYHRVQWRSKTLTWVWFFRKKSSNSGYLQQNFKMIIKVPRVKPDWILFSSAS